jgi:hypothetical protein
MRRPEKWMTLVPGNNPFDVQVRAEERAAEEDRRAREAAARGAMSRRPVNERVSLVERVRRLLRRR